jgi:hypothetical protein
MAAPLPSIGGMFGIDPNMRRRIGNVLTDFGGGLLQGKNFQQGLGLGAQQMAQMQPYRDQQEQMVAQQETQATQTNATINWLKSKGYDDLVAAVGGGLPIGDAWQEGLKRANPAPVAQAQPTAAIQEYQFAVQNGYDGSFMDFQTQKGGVSEMSLTPTYGIDPATGKTVLGQLGKDGKFHPTEMGGVQAISPYELAGQKAGGTVDAKTAANARAALPGAEQTASITIAAIDKILGDTQGQAENFGNTFGIPNQMTPTFPGSPKANFWVNVQQAQGGAFLQARTWLKGQGAITEMESAKAEGAMSAMEMAAKSGNQEAFVQAVQAFREAVLQGVENVKQLAQGGYAAGEVPSMAAPSSGSDVDAILKDLGI